MKKNSYTQEFKESTVRFCLDNEDRTISSIAKDLGLNKGTLSLWVNDYKVKNNLKTSSNEVKKETLEEENKRLRKELALVKQEREILKKAAAYFAKETL